MTPATSLETLPTELVVTILKQLHSNRSLRNSLRASARLRSVYRSRSEEIYTTITIRQLTRRGFDPLQPSKTLSIQRRDYRYPLRAIRDAVQILYETCQQHISTERTGSITCAVNVCTVALHMRKAVGWNLQSAEDGALGKTTDIKHWSEWLEFPCSRGEYWKEGLVSKKRSAADAGFRYTSQRKFRPARNSQARSYPTEQLS